MPLHPGQLRRQEAGRHHHPAGLIADRGHEVGGEIVAAQAHDPAHGVGQLLQQRFGGLPEVGDLGADQRLVALEEEGQDRIARLRDIVQGEEGPVLEHRPGPVGELPPAAGLDQLGGKAAAEAALGQVARRKGAPLVEPDRPAGAEAGEGLGQPAVMRHQGLGAGGLEVGCLEAGGAQETTRVGEDDLLAGIERHEPGQPVGELLVAPPAEPPHGRITRGIRKPRPRSSQAKAS